MPEEPDMVSDDAATLSALLVEAGLLLAGQSLVPLSGGRTNRLWRASGPSTDATDQTADDLVIKLFAATPDNPLFANDPAAEARLLDHLTGTGLAPRLRATLETPLGPVLLYTHVAGTPWHSDPAPVARTLAALHRHPAPPGLTPAPIGSQDLLRQGLDILARCSDGPAAEQLRDLTPQRHVAPTGRAALLHGDAVPGNIIQASDGTVTLIDWQCPALGDPIHDLAIFLSPAMQHVYRGATLTPTQEEQFLAAYGCDATREYYQVLAPWAHWRMAAYCLWRSEHGASDYRAAFTLECARISP